MQNLSFLLVEDSADDAFFFKQTVTEAGLSNAVHWIETGAEAVTYLAGEGRYRNRIAFPFPSVMFLDLVLKDMNGLDVLTTVRPLYPSDDLLIIVLSGTDNPSAVRTASRRMADAFMRKPIRPKDLLNLAAQFPFHF
jgi:two-component system, response regulator